MKNDIRVFVKLMAAKKCVLNCLEKFYEIIQIQLIPSRFMAFDTKLPEIAMAEDVGGLSLRPT